MSDDRRASPRTVLANVLGERRAGLRRQLRRPSVLSIPISLVFGIVFALLTPPLWGFDEPGHVARVSHIVSGEFLASSDPTSPANAMPDDFIELATWRTTDILDHETGPMVLGRKDVTDPAIYDRLEARPFGGPEHLFPAIARYPAVAYPGPVVGVAISRLLGLDIGATLLLARLLSVLTFTAVTAVAIALMEGTRLAPLFLVAGLLPTAVFQGAMVSADTLANPGALLYLALLWRTTQRDRASGAIYAALAAVTILLPLVKASFLLLTALSVLAAPRDLPRRWMRVAYRIAPIAVATCAAAAWTVVSQVDVAGTGTQRADDAPVSPGAQLAHLLHAPLSFPAAVATSLFRNGDYYLRSTLVTASGNSIEVPFVAVLALGVVLVLCGLYARRPGRPYTSYVVWTAISSILTVVGVFGSLYLAFNPVGAREVEGVGGRYFTTLVVPASLLISRVLPVRLVSREGPMVALAAGTSSAVLAVSVCWVWLALW